MEDDLQTERPKNGWRRWVPLPRWAKGYGRAEAVADAVAGATLGLTLVPQSLAYASLADRPVHFGLYSAFVGPMLYVFLGTVKEVSIGPTSLMALLTLQACRDLPTEYVVLLTFLSGCIVLAMGLLRLGFLVDLISPSVTSGFTSGTAVIIVASQLKGLLGLSFAAESVVDNVTAIAANWRRVRLNDCLLSAGCCAALLSLRKLKDLRVSAKRVRLGRALWLVSIGRNALVVVASAALAFVVHREEEPPFALSGRVEPGLPSVALPAFRAAPTPGAAEEGPLQMARRLGSALVLVPIVMVLSNISIAKAFCRGGRVAATREMVTLGLVNVAGSLVQALPSCGAFTRSAVSHASGVRTPAAGLYSGVITLLALGFMTPYFYYIPKASLSSVLICAVVFMVDVSGLREAWRRDRAEAAVLAVTFVMSLWRGVETGLAVGAAASAALLLRRLMRAHIDLRAVPAMRSATLLARPAIALLYLNAERFVGRVRRAAAAEAPAFVLVDCRDLALIDCSAGQVLERLSEELAAADRKLILFNASGEVLSCAQRLERLERRALCASTPQEVLEALTSTAAPPAAADTVSLVDNGGTQIIVKK